MQILHIFEFCSASWLAGPNSKMCRICIRQHDAIERKRFSVPPIVTQISINSLETIKIFFGRRIRACRRWRTVGAPRRRMTRTRICTRGIHACISHNITRPRPHAVRGPACARACLTCSHSSTDVHGCPYVSLHVPAVSKLSTSPCHVHTCAAAAYMS